MFSLIETLKNGCNSKRQRPVVTTNQLRNQVQPKLKPENLIQRIIAQKRLEYKQKRFQQSRSTKRQDTLVDQKNGRLHQQQQSQLSSQEDDQSQLVDKGLVDTVQKLGSDNDISQKTHTMVRRYPNQAISDNISSISIKMRKSES